MSECLRLFDFITIENKLIINIFLKLLNIHPAKFIENFMRFKSGCKGTLVKYFLVFFTVRFKSGKFQRNNYKLFHLLCTSYQTT